MVDIPGSKAMFLEGTFTETICLGMIENPGSEGFLEQSFAETMCLDIGPLS